MHVVKVYLNNGEIHVHPGKDCRFMHIDNYGNLEMGREQNSGVLENLTAGYPKGSWLYYRIFRLRG